VFECHLRGHHWIGNDVIQGELQHLEIVLGFPMIPFACLLHSYPSHLDSFVRPRHRPANDQNIYRTATAVPLGFGYVSQFSGVPQIVLPIGQVAYNSTISNHTEYLPLTVTMYAAQGCDYMLWDLAAALQVSVATARITVKTRRRLMIRNLGSSPRSHLGRSLTRRSYRRIGAGSGVLREVVGGDVIDGIKGLYRGSGRYIIHY
jgi:hypothetical protein